MGGFQLVLLLFIYAFSHFQTLIVINAIFWKFLRHSSRLVDRSNIQLYKLLFQGQFLSQLVPINLLYLQYIS